MGDVLHRGGDRVIMSGDDLAQHVQTVRDFTVLQVEQMMVDPVEHVDGVGVDVGTRQTQIGVQACFGDGVPYLFGDKSGALGALRLCPGVFAQDAVDLGGGVV